MRKNTGSSKEKTEGEINKGYDSPVGPKKLRDSRYEGRGQRQGKSTRHSFKDDGWGFLLLQENMRGVRHSWLLPRPQGRIFTNKMYLIDTCGWDAK